MMASIFFTDFASRRFLKFQTAAHSQRLCGRATRSMLGTILGPGELPEITRDYPSSSAGFLKSRVYAKLLTALILECYQTFNGRPVGVRCIMPMIRQPTK